MKRVIFIIGIILMSICVTSCEKETKQDLYNYNTGSSGNTDNHGSGDDIARLISQNVNVSSNYTHSYYMYKVNVSSSLSTAYPYHSISYGVECGYGDYAFYKERTGSGSISFNVPIFTDVNQYTQNEPWGFSKTSVWPNGQLPTDESMVGTIYYYKVYYALRVKKDSGQSLTSDETNLYNSTMEKLNAVETRARNLFVFRSYVIVDGVKYII